MLRPVCFRTCVTAAAAGGLLLLLLPTGAAETGLGGDVLRPSSQPKSSPSGHPSGVAALEELEHVDAVRGESSTWLWAPTLRSLGAAGLAGVSLAFVVAACASQDHQGCLLCLVGALFLALGVILKLTGDTEYESPFFHELSAGLVGAAIAITGLGYQGVKREQVRSIRPHEDPSERHREHPEHVQNSKDKFVLMMVIGALIMVLAVFCMFLQDERTAETGPIQVGCNACCGAGPCDAAWHHELGQCCAPNSSGPAVCCPALRSRLAVNQYQCVPPQGEGDWGCRLGPPAQLEPRSCNRRTGGSCNVVGCDVSRGPTACVGGQCMCKPGFCALDGKCSKDACEKEGVCSRTCDRETSGACKVMPCHPWRSARCEEGRCVCAEGRGSSPDGVCQPTGACAPGGAALQSSAAAPGEGPAARGRAAPGAVLGAAAALAALSAALSLALAVRARRRPPREGRAPLLAGSS